jgi:hypothetical protein
MILKKFAPIEMLVLFLGIMLYSQTSLSGDISKYLLDAANSPFVVEKDIEVPSKKKVVINEGCVFLFKPFTGINVSGSLIVNGTQSHPVIFTTVNDSLYGNQKGQTANPFDWNGIIINNDADEIDFKEFKLMYSVYGIKSQRRDIVIKNGKFKSNGQFHFTIFDKIQYVQDNVSFSYPNDSSMVYINPQQSFKTTLSISSSPSKAEIYINTKPGKRISPDARTPAVIKNVKGPVIQMTLFKKGYSDSTVFLNLAPNKTKNIDISLNPLRPEAIDIQNRILRDRFHARVGRFCFITSPLFILAGAGCLYYAEKNYKNAEEANSNYNRSMRPENSPEKIALKKQFDDETTNGNVKRNIAIGSFGIGAIALVAGLCFYF